jgi:hypothetical protein
MGADVLVVVIVIVCAIILYIGKLYSSSSKYEVSRVHPT